MSMTAYANAPQIVFNKCQLQTSKEEFILYTTQASVSMPKKKVLSLQFYFVVRGNWIDFSLSFSFYGGHSVLE